LLDKDDNYCYDTDVIGDQTVKKLTLWAIVTLISTASAAADIDAKLVDIGEHSLYLHCSGEGTPTLLLDAGLGGSHLDWSLVQPALALDYRVCSYDRAGYGLSQMGPTPRDAQSLAQDLVDLLQHPQFNPKSVVLVGHSLAGFHLRLVSQQLPERVQALVLIEAAHEDQFDEFWQRAKLRLAPKRGDRIRLSPPAVPKQLKAATRERALAYASEQKSLLTLRSELLNFSASADKLSQQDTRIRQPLLVISRGETQWKTSPDAELREAIWQELQAKLVALSDKSSQLVVEHSGHFVHLEQPERVISAIDQFTRRLHSPEMQALSKKQPCCSDFVAATTYLNGCCQ